ncbi:MAG: gliding motility-associated C-terminal domain-containing protein, partial [Bacteroidia bacterium]|nr:gliding motility-associated C-terminal domain-containing protein [Bacteroidia bacterium]
NGYDVKLVTTNSFPGGKCVTVTDKPGYIKVWPNPVADFTSDPEFFTTVALPRFNFINKSKIKFGTMSYLWSFGTDNPDDTSTKKDPTFTYTEDTLKYWVSLYVVSDHGCDSLKISQRIIGPDVTVFIPNAFSPDGAGIATNNVFRAVVNGEKSFFLQIYNRWGELLFETDDKYKEWNGIYQGQACQQDVYVYAVKVTAFDGKIYRYDGTFTLLK